MDDDALYLIVKRDLYYRPNSIGYTGIRDNAGRWPKAEAELMICPHEGVTMIAESEAPEFTGACYDDLARKHLAEQRDALRADVTSLAADRDEVLFRLSNRDVELGEKMLAIEDLRADVTRLTASLAAAEGESARLRAGLPGVRGKLHDIMCLPDEAGALVVAQNWARAIDAALGAPS